MQIPTNIIISRTDSIGDVVLTLPVAGVLKKYFPHIKIGFLGRAYTRPVIEACKYVDEFIDIKEFLDKRVSICGQAPVAILHVYPSFAIAMRAKKLQIPLQIGTTNRIYHWFTCNKLVKLSRKNSSLHEAVLNLKLLKPLGINEDFGTETMSKFFGLTRIEPLQESFSNLIDESRYNLILHPKSQGNTREWGTDYFTELIQLLSNDRYKIFISGTQQERQMIQVLFDSVGDKVTDITGTMNLGQFISFIAHCDGIVANSTGPLHIAAALGKDVLGIYPPIRPMHPQRWAPLSAKAKVFVINRECNDCKNKSVDCHCIREIKPSMLQQTLNDLYPSLQN